MITVYLCFRVVMRITRYSDIDLIKRNSAAASIVLAAAFVSVAIMAKSALYPINAVLQDLWFNTMRTAAEFLIFCGRSLGYMALTLVLSIASVAAALKLFERLTPELDEETRISENNVAVGILLAGVLIAFAILMESGIRDFVNTLIPVSGLTPVE